MMDAWDRAVAAEWRRCKRQGFIFSQPGVGWRQDCYRAGDLVELIPAVIADRIYERRPSWTS